MPSEFLVALPVDPMPVGTRYPLGTPLPLHCTLMQWFWIQDEAKFVSLTNKLMMFACSVEENEIELISEAPALFGPEKDVPVHVLMRNERLNLLHTKLLIFLSGQKCAPAAHPWIGAGYRPHVTSNGSTFVPGSRHVPKSLVLIQRDRGKTKLVRGEYELGGIPF